MLVARVADAVRLVVFATPHAAWVDEAVAAAVVLVPSAHWALHHSFRGFAAIACERRARVYVHRACRRLMTLAITFALSSIVAHAPTQSPAIEYVVPCPIHC